MYFEELVDKISPRLKAIAKKLERKFAFFDADDLYQEALIHLWEKHKNGELSDKTESYILQGAFFFLRNYIRVAYKKVDSQSISLSKAVDNNGDKEALEDIFFAHCPDKQFGFVVIDILVEDILSCLTQREKEVFLLCLDELTTREIARHLGVSHPMVVKIEKRIREKCDVFRKEIF